VLKVQGQRRLARLRSNQTVNKGAEDCGVGPK
jgi:hypothetical protein